MNRPVIYPERHLMLHPSLCGEVRIYIGAWRVGSYGFDWTIRFDKRHKSAHRFSIADTRGRLDLTVPVCKPESSRCGWDEIRVSTHGAWWDVHRVALESAYGRTPYFEFYIDRYLPMLTTGVTDRFPLLKDLAEAWERQAADILGLTLDNHRDKGEGIIVESSADFDPEVFPYRQVRADKLGFIPGLSILDLIFNLGPESQIYLNEMAEKTYVRR